MTQPSVSSRNSRTMLRSAAAVALMASVAGCAAQGGSTRIDRYEPTYVRLTEERAFAQALRERYLELATEAYDRGDFERSDFYSLRSIMAVEGKLAEPMAITGRSFGAADGEANQVAARLRAAFDSGIRTGSPEFAARAQAAYDCWLLESSPGGNPQIAAACRYNTYQALAQVEAAALGRETEVAGGSRQIVIDPDMPSQVIDIGGGTTVEIIQTPATQESIEYVRRPAARQVAPAIVESVPAPIYDPQFSAPIQGAPRVSEPMVVFDAPFSAETAPGRTYGGAEFPIYDGGTVEAAPGPIYGGTFDSALYEPQTTFGTPAPTYDSVPLPEIAMAEPIAPGPIYGGAPVESFPVFQETPGPAQPSVTMPESLSLDGVAGALLEAGNRGDMATSIFFGFDSSEITPEALEVLESFVAELRDGGATRVTLIGLTDSAGDAQYNQLLAMRRAQAVRKYLASKTDGQIAFEILPVGEAEAVTVGGDGVVDALSRRVDLSWE